MIAERSPLLTLICVFEARHLEVPSNPTPGPLITRVYDSMSKFQKYAHCQI